mgnify:FL=1
MLKQKWRSNNNNRTTYKSNINFFFCHIFFLLIEKVKISNISTNYDRISQYISCFLLNVPQLGPFQQNLYDETLKKNFIKMEFDKKRPPLPFI